VAFGGSGPVHALRIAKKLRIGRIVCPAGAGVMSAFGLLASPLSFETFRSHRVALDGLSETRFVERFAELEEVAIRPLLDAGLERSGIRLLRRLDMRYVGQGYEVEVRLPEAPLASVLTRLAELFAEAYQAVFRTSFEGRTIEIVNWKVEALGP